MRARLAFEDVLPTGYMDMIQGTVLKVQVLPAYAETGDRIRRP